MRLNPFKRDNKKSFTGLSTTTTPEGWGTGYGGYVFYEDIVATGSAIYSTQPSVRTVVDFLSRNIAQIGIKLYDRIDDDEREALTDHPLQYLLNHPSPTQTRYSLMYATIADLCLYDASFWLKVQGPAKKAIVRMPPEYVTVYGGMTPVRYKLQFPGGDPQYFTPAEVVHFHGYNPTSMTTGTSPMETLKNIIAEDIAASRNRRGFWNRSARMEGIIKRPKDAPELSVEGKKRFLEDWEAATSGGGNAGKTGLLEEGMDWVPTSFSPKEAEFINGRVLTMSQVARAFHVPLPMVGLTDTANFASIREYHLMLYQETLPPWMVFIEEEIELQMFPDFSGLQNAYAEFNISEKLKGSFEEQASILSTSVGAPWMTVEEARARVNLPNDPESLANLIMPLNVIVGGQPSPQTPLEVPEPDDDEMPMQSASFTAAEFKALAERTRDKYEIAHEETFKKFFTRQRDVIMSSSKASKPFDTRRWNKELAEDLTPLALATSSSAGAAAARKFGSEYDPGMTLHYLEENVKIAARNINAQTNAALKAAGSDADALKAVFDVAIGSRAAQLSTSRATGLTSFGTHEAAKQAGRASKTWIVTNPKSRHPELNGETVGIDSTFSNGLNYPGDPTGGADEGANCQCLLDYQTQ